MARIFESSVVSILVLASLLLGCHGVSDVTLQQCSGDVINFQVTADTTTQDDADDWYIQYTVAGAVFTCSQTASGVVATPGTPAAGVTIFTVAITGITTGVCGNYDSTGTPDYTMEVVIPYLNFLVTQSDQIVELKCVLSEVFSTQLAPSQAASTLAADVTKKMDVDMPIVAGYIYQLSQDLVPATLTIGTSVRAFVEITDGKSGYWTKIIIDTLKAEDENQANDVLLITDKACVTNAYQAQLGVSYTPTPGTSSAVTFTAFKYQGSSHLVYFTAAVTVCSKDYTGTACTKSSPCPADTTRRRRHISHDDEDSSLLGFADDSESEHDDEAAPSAYHKILRLAMVVTDPGELAYNQNLHPRGEFGPLSGEIDEVEINDTWCVPRASGVAVLVSLLITGLFAATISTVCVCLKQRNRTMIKQRLVSEGSVSSLPSTRCSFPDDYVYHSSGRSALVDSDYLQAMSGSGKVMAVIDEHLPCGALSTIAEETSARQSGR